MGLSADDRIGLLQTHHLYVHVLNGLWDLIDRVFTPDAVFDPSAIGMPVMRGDAQIRDTLEVLYIS